MEESGSSGSIVGMRKILLSLHEERSRAEKEENQNEVVRLDVQIELQTKAIQKEIETFRGQLIQSQMEEQ